MTWQVDKRVRSCAAITGDNTLLGKIGGGDMIAAETKYHPSCLLALYDRAAHVLATVESDTINVACVSPVCD